MFLETKGKTYLVVLQYMNIKGKEKMQESNMKSDNNPVFHQSKDIIILEGFFFIRTNTIIKNTDIVKQTFKDFPSMVNQN